MTPLDDANPLEEVTPDEQEAHGADPGLAADDATAYDRTIESSANVDGPDATLDILQPATITESPTAAGPIADIAAPWQTLPPGYSDTYLLWESTSLDEQGISVTQSLWIDERTRMPLKEVLSRSDSPDLISYWSYEPLEVPAAELPLDFIVAPPPATVEQETDVVGLGAADLNTATDLETGTQFTPYYLGLSPQTTAGAYCLSSLYVVEMIDHTVEVLPTQDAELPPPDQPDAVQTFTDAVYDKTETGETCQPGTSMPTSGEPTLQVTSLAEAATSAANVSPAYEVPALAIESDSSDPFHDTAGTTVLPLNGLTQTYVLPIDAKNGVTTGDVASTVLAIPGDALVTVSCDCEKESLIWDLTSLGAR